MTKESSQYTDRPSKRPCSADNSLQSTLTIRRKTRLVHRSLLQRFMPFMNDKERRERSSANVTPQPSMLTPPTTPVISAVSSTTDFTPKIQMKMVPPRKVLDEEIIDLSSEDESLDVEECSDCSNDCWSSGSSTVDLNEDDRNDDEVVVLKNINVNTNRNMSMPFEHMVQSSRVSQTHRHVSEEVEPMDISMDEGAVNVESRSNIVGVFPRNANVQQGLNEYGDSYEEEIARVFRHGSPIEEPILDDSEDSSDSTNGRGNRPRVAANYLSQMHQTPKPTIQQHHQPIVPINLQNRYNLRKPPMTQSKPVDHQGRLRIEPERRIDLVQAGKQNVRRFTSIESMDQDYGADSEVLNANAVSQTLNVHAVNNNNNNIQNVQNIQNIQNHNNMNKNVMNSATSQTYLNSEMAMHTRSTTTQMYQNYQVVTQPANCFNNVLPLQMPFGGHLPLVCNNVMPMPINPQIYCLAPQNLMPMQVGFVSAVGGYLLIPAYH